jgi:DNA-binding response OmpR family regulator
VRLGNSLRRNIPVETQTAAFKNQAASLAGTRVLIVEDDERLLGRLASLFSANGVGQIDMAGCIEEAFHLLNDSKHEYDLIILDMMLPETREDFEAIRAGEMQLAETHAILENAQILDGSLDASQIQSARSKRTTLLRNIDGLIVREGALKLLERWQLARSKKAQLPHIIFLTALGNDAEIAHGSKLAGKGSAWLVKPVTDKTIIDRAVEVLSNSQSA